MFRDLFHYAAFHLADIADTARDVDLAIRWGYGWKLGPFETWQAAGWQDVAKWIAEDIAGGKAMSRPFRRGLLNRVGLVAGPPIPASAVTPAALRERVAALLAS